MKIKQDIILILIFGIIAITLVIVINYSDKIAEDNIHTCADCFKIIASEEFVVENGLVCWDCKEKRE